MLQDRSLCNVICVKLERKRNQHGKRVEDPQKTRHEAAAACIGTEVNRVCGRTEEQV